MTEQQFKPGDRVRGRGTVTGTIEAVRITYHVLWDGVTPSHPELPHNLEPYYCDTCKNTGLVTYPEEDASGNGVDEPCPKGCKAPEELPNDQDLPWGGESRRPG